MPLKTVVDTLDGLDEAVQSLYTETENGYVLDVEDVDAHPSVANLKSAYERTKADREAARKEREAMKAKLDAIPEDFDPEKWAEIAKGAKKSDSDELVKLREKLEAEKGDWQKKYEAEVSRNRQMAVERTLDTALTEQGITNPAYLKAARALISSSVQVNESGEPIVDTDMGPIPLAEHVARWVAGEGKAFVTPASGGGAKGNDSGAKAGGSKKAKDMTDGEKGVFIRENGLDAWKEKLERERS